MEEIAEENASSTTSLLPLADTRGGGVENTLTDSRETSNNDRGYTDPGVKVTTAPLVTVDVLPAKVAQTVGSEEPVGGGDVVHVVHETEWSVGEDSTITLHEINGLVGEGPDLVHAGLGTAVEVLHVRGCN